jgi:hypothetical protein
VTARVTENDRSCGRRADRLELDVPQGEAETRSRRPGTPSGGPNTYSYGTVRLMIFDADD